jgi:hypothetical protein
MKGKLGEKYNQSTLYKSVKNVSMKTTTFYN